MTDSPLTRKQQFWLDHIQAADRSNGSIAAYAAQHSISAKALYAWKTRLIRQKRYSPTKTSDFTPIKPSSELLSSLGGLAESPSCRVTLPTGARIEFMGDLTPATVRSILTLAGASR